MAENGKPDDTMNSPAPQRGKAAPRRRWRLFRKNQSGATAVEFGLIAIPFFMLLMSTFEMALMLWTNQEMEEAIFQESRPMLTGDSRTTYANPATAANDFRDKLCTKMSLISNCSTRLKVDVQSYASFATAQSNSAVSGGVLNTTAFGFQPATPSTIIVVRAVLSYPLVLSAWSKSFANLANGERALMASIAFRTEPFPP
jgi:Flp pilus assembly protein TadG